MEAIMLLVKVDGKRLGAIAGILHVAVVVPAHVLIGIPYAIVESYRVRRSRRIRVAHRKMAIAELNSALSRMPRPLADKIRKNLSRLNNIVRQNACFSSFADLISKLHGAYQPAFGQAVYNTTCPGDETGLLDLQEAYNAVMAALEYRNGSGGIKSLFIV
jgi:hypothetical protein